MPDKIDLSAQHQATGISEKSTTISAGPQKVRHPPLAVKNWERLEQGEDRAQERLVCAADTEKISLLHLFMHGKRNELLSAVQGIYFFHVLKCTGVMYFPCYFFQLSLRDTSLNPISGYVPLKCYSELLNMFYKLAHPKSPATQPHSVMRLHNSRKPMR